MRAVLITSASPRISATDPSDLYTTWNPDSLFSLPFRASSNDRAAALDCAEPNA